MPDVPASSLPKSHDYENFELDIVRGKGKNYEVSVIHSPGGEAQSTMDFPFDKEEREDFQLKLQNALLLSSGAYRQTVSQETEVVQKYGSNLFEALLAGDVRTRYEVACNNTLQKGVGLRLVLRIAPPELAALPWEFMYDPHQKEFIGLSRDRPVVRYMETPLSIKPLAVSPPLRILGMIASPSGLPGLDVEAEKRRMEDAVKDLIASGLVSLTWIPGQTWRDLQTTLMDGTFHIFHFIGHGGFDTVADEGLIYLAGENQNAYSLHASELGTLLKGYHSLRLVMLSSCEGGRGSEKDIFSSMASLLVLRGIPAVVAMQYAITDKAAIEFSRTFYTALAKFMPVDAAVTEARMAISLAVPHSFEWGVPVLYMRASQGVIFAPGSLNDQESERLRIAALEAERKRQAELEAERMRIAAVEAERKRQAEQEAERKRLEAEEAEQKRLAGLDTERKRIEAAEAEIKRLKEEDEERKRIEEDQKRQAELEIERQHQRQRTMVTWTATFAVLILLVFLGLRLFTIPLAKPTDAPQVSEAPAVAPSSTINPAVNPSYTPSFTRAPTAVPVIISTFTPISGDIVSPTPLRVVTRISPKDSMVQVYVPAGVFVMGSDKSTDPDAEDRELPQHAVVLDAFWIDRTEVTNAMYEACAAVGVCSEPSSASSQIRESYFRNLQFDNFPVIYISWMDADAYCHWAGKRLPTEAEWEKAARGVDGQIYPWQGAAVDCLLANYQGCTGDTSAVGSHLAGASPYGALDMAGNVWEWVADWYDPGYYQNSAMNNPLGSPSGSTRVVRGGSWFFEPKLIRAAVRRDRIPTYTNVDIGFRCASTP